MARDTVRVVNEHSARFHLAFEFVHTLLVQNDGRIESLEGRRTDRLVADDDRHVRGTATHLGTVGRKPRNLVVLHDTRISQNLTCGEHALPAESCYN